MRASSVIRFLEDKITGARRKSATLYGVNLRRLDILYVVLFSEIFSRICSCKSNKIATLFQTTLLEAV